MGRIPSTEIERLKREISVAELASARGVKCARRPNMIAGIGGT